MHAVFTQLLAVAQVDHDRPSLRAREQHPRLAPPVRLDGGDVPALHATHDTPHSTDRRVAGGAERFGMQNPMPKIEGTENAVLSRIVIPFMMVNREESGGIR